MKRSEMIDILYNYFNETCYQDYIPDAGAVIDILEKEGMLPPPDNKKEFEQLCYQYDIYPTWDKE